MSNAFHTPVKFRDRGAKVHGAKVHGVKVHGAKVHGAKVVLLRQCSSNQRLWKRGFSFQTAFIATIGEEDLTPDKTDNIL